MGKNYFAILGISSTASEEEIRSAYRRLAKAYHPDHFEGGNQPFREIQEAYSVLGDPRRRSQYRQALVRHQPMRSSRAGLYKDAEPLIPEDRQPMDVDDISPVRAFRTFSPSLDEILNLHITVFFRPDDME
jgi:molecular chaperone DnaJ